MAKEITIAREGSVNPVNAERTSPSRRRASVESFLEGYSPRNRGFTTNAEIKKITEALKLDGMSAYELTEARNDVVRYYSRQMTDSNRSWNLMPSLQSVTAVIDDLKYRKYGFV